MKKIISYLAAVMLVFTMVPYTAFATADQQQAAESINLEIEQHNPIYSDETPTVEIIESDDDITLFSEPAPVSDDEYVATIEEAAALLRAGMVARQAEVVIKMQLKASEFTETAISEKTSAIFRSALEHTGKPQEGDSLKWVYKECPMAVSASGDGVNYYATITYAPTYYTTAAQEAELTEAVENLKSELDLDGKTDYEKVKAIYNYMTANISYDYENLNDSTHTLKFTAYAALINKTSVCQGYAVLFYRMACEYGIDARVIAGTSLNNKGQSEGHGWNIVNLEDKYYNLDATWDSTWDNDKTTHDFFLRGTDTFKNHTRNTEFTTSEFNACYPMSAADYSPELEGVSHMFVTQTVEPTCTTDGYDQLICINCGLTGGKSNFVSRTGHSYGEWIIDKKATCTTAGSRHKECAKCGKVVTVEIPAKHHKWENFYTVDKKATIKDAGSKSKHCAVCNVIKSGSSVTIAKIKSIAASTLVYNGKNRTQNVKVVNSKGKSLVKGTDFTVTYKNAKGTKVVTPKNVGTYKAVIKFKGRYSGTVTKTFKINPKATTISKLTKPAKKQIKVTWKKQSAQVTGYQVRYSTKKSMSGAKKLTVNSYKTTSKTIKSLKSGKKYYVQVRTYKKVGGTPYYSAWSAKKYITTK